jgi:hypothetical protein
LITVNIGAQGSLFAVAYSSPTHASAPSGGRTRGLVNEFSRKSRGRLIRLFARLDPPKASFLTLTYPARFPTPDIAKQHLRALLERFRRAWPEMSAIWKMEFQERGAVHFHLLLINAPFIPWVKLRMWWTLIINDYVDQWYPRVEIQQCKSKKHAGWYVSKYIGKTVGAQEQSSDYFITMPYPHAGRFWGVFNRPKLPYAALSYVTASNITVRDLADIKKLMRRFWPRINTSRFRGAVIYTDRSQAVFTAVLRLIRLPANEASP